MARSDFYIKKDDTAPFLLAQLRDSNDTPISLVGATVRFVMVDSSGATKIDAPAVVIDAVDGRVRYEWTAADTNTAGTFAAEFEATLPGGRVLSVPNRRNLSIRIMPDLGGIT